jgi:hypothetical protein
MAHTTTDTEAAPDWLSRVEASLKPPTEIPFEFKDDGGSESKALGSSVAAGEENEEKGSPIEEAAPFAQMAKLRISHSSSSSQDEVSDVSGEETSAEDALVSAENDVVSTDQTIVNQAVANMSYHKGIANKHYFNAGLATDPTQRRRRGQNYTQSSLIAHGIVNGSDVEKLFEL